MRLACRRARPWFIVTPGLQEIGREIVEIEQAGAKRAGYGDEVIARLAEGSSVG